MIGGIGLHVLPPLRVIFPVRIVAAVLCLFVGLPAAPPLCADEPSAWELYEQGRAAEKAGHMAQAYLFYAEAAAMDPKNSTYWQHSQAIRTRASLEGLVMPEATTAAADPVPEEPVFQPEARATPRDLWDAARLSVPPELLAGRWNRRCRPARRFQTDLAGSCQALRPRLHLRPRLPTHGTDAVPFKERRFPRGDTRPQAATSTVIFPVTSKVFMVAKDTPQKRTELQPRVAVSIPLPDSVTQQDFNQAVTAIQQSVGIEKIAFDTQTKTVILRDTPAKLTAARALFQDLMRPPGQVMVELKLIEVTRNDMLTYGIDFPNVFSLKFLTNWLGNQFTPPTNISAF